MNFKTLFILLFLVTGISQASFAQLSGNVTDNKTGEALSEVHILNYQQEIIGHTNQLGDFTLPADLIKNQDTLIFTHIGYKSFKLCIKNLDGTSVSVRMEPTSIELENAIVTASRDQQSRKDAPVAMSVMNTKRISDLNSNNTPDLLNKISSVHIADFGNEQQSMAIRQPLSFSRTQLVILEDGVPIGPTAIATSGDLREVNLTNINKIEVLRGPGSSIYGSEAIGGVVNFITYRPSKHPQANIGVQFSSLGYKRTDLRASASKGRFGFLIGGYYANTTNGYRENSDFRKTAISMKATYLLSDKVFLTLKGTYIDFYTDWPGSLDSLHFFTDDTYNSNRIGFKDNQIFRTSLRSDFFWNKNNKSFITVFHRNNTDLELPAYLIRTDYSSFPPKISGEKVNSQYQSYGFVAQHRMKLDRFKSILYFGLSSDYTPNVYKSEYLKVSKDSTGIYSEYEVTDECVQNFEAQLLNSGAYINLEVNPFSKMKIVAGVRYDRLDYNFDNKLEPGAISGAPDEKNTFDHISPKLGLTYQITKTAGAYANFSVGFAPPLFSQLYKMVEVPELEPSTYKNYEIGGWMSIIKNKVYIDLSAYRSDGKNEIVSVLQPDFSTVNKSVGQTLHYGLEYSIRANVLKDFTIYVNATNCMHKYIDFVDGSKDYSGNEMDIAPNFIAHSGITWRPTSFMKGFRISFEMQKLGPYYMDGLNSDEYEGYTLFNTRVAYQYKGLEIWSNVLNLTDELYASRVSRSYYGPVNVVTSYSPGVRRTVFVGLRYNIARNK